MSNLLTLLPWFLLGLLWAYLTTVKKALKSALAEQEHQLKAQSALLEKVRHRAQRLAHNQNLNHAALDAELEKLGALRDE
ncbi:MAG: hypothetical protein Q4B71_00410 [Cardiobacteriaceae bacterium]|nr:hypothetical protein [Cardiobacteriaceae bacterium]